MAGELKIVASADLGGLGANQGDPVLYNWTRSGMLAAVLPWLALAGLLGVRANRSPKAWWVWPALAAVLMAIYGTKHLVNETTAIPNQIADFLAGAFGALGMGLAALWLLCPCLGNRSRMAGFWATLLVIGGFGGFALLSGGVAVDEKAAAATVLLVFSVAVSLALSLAALTCRRRFTKGRFLLYLMGWLVGGCVLVVAVVSLIVSIAMHEPPPVEVLLVPLGLGCWLAVMLAPFLALSFLVAFHQERLLLLLRLAPVECPGGTSGGTSSHQPA